MIKMSNEITIVLPKTNNEGVAFTYERHLKAIAENFGGYTLLEQKGGWVSDDGKLMIDKAERLIINCDEILAENFQPIQALLQFLFCNVEQLAVFIKINNVACIMENNQADWNELTKLLNI